MNKVTVDRDSLLKKMEAALTALQAARQGYKDGSNRDWTTDQFKAAARSLLDAERILKEAQQA